MRFSCNIFLKKRVKIPSDYRSCLLSLIKEAIKKSGNDGEEFYNQYYSNGNITKPFTFSAYIPMKNQNNENLLNGDFFKFFFSTNDYEFLMRVYNGLIAVNNTDFKLFGSDIDIKNFSLSPEKVFVKREIFFKTLSPFLVRCTVDGDKYLYPYAAKKQVKNKGKYWEEMNESAFIDSLKKNLLKLVEKELPEAPKTDIHLELKNPAVVPIIHGSGNKEHSYKMIFPGIKGGIKISASPEVLKLFYDIGIGARRSEGFGMLEAVE